MQKIHVCLDKNYLVFNRDLICDLDTEEYVENEKLINIDFSNTEITSKLTNLLTDTLL